MESPGPPFSQDKISFINSYSFTLIVKRNLKINQIESDLETRTLFFVFTSRSDSFLAATEFDQKK